MGLFAWLIAIFIIIIIIIVAVIIIAIVLTGKDFLDCITHPFTCVFGGKNVKPGDFCVTSTQCASGICKSGRCMNSDGTLNPGDKCTVGPKARFCPTGFHCGGIPTICRANNPNGLAPGATCGSDGQCASGICIIEGISKCADDNGKLPTGTYCGLSPWGPNLCMEVCESGQGAKISGRAGWFCT